MHAPNAHAHSRKPRQNSKAKGIPQGTRGIIVSTVAGKERQATREALAILSESLEALGGPKREDGADGAAGDDGADGADGAEKGANQDISALLKAEVEDLKDRSKQDFRVRDMGLPSTVYLVCNFSSPSPSEILYHALDTVRRTQQNKCRFCYRWFPIEYTCRAELEAIKAMGKQVARDVFGDGNKKEDDKTFAVDVEFRAKPKELERLDVINAFASEIGQPPWKVDLSSPDLSIVVNVGIDFRKPRARTDSLTRATRFARSPGGQRDVWVRGRAGISGAEEVQLDHAGRYWRR